MPETDPRGLRRAYQEARFALEAADPVAGDAGPGSRPSATWAATACCWPGRRTPPSEAISRSLLGPLADYDRRQHGDLVASLRAFLEHNGNWEAAARALGVHRHTLRYRVRRVAELTGRDLDQAADRVEFWLALQAADVLQGRVGLRAVGVILRCRSGRSTPTATPDRTWTAGRDASVPSCPCGRIGGSAV
jgi:hypothetical protein